MIKKIIAVVLAIIMMFSTIITVFAENKDSNKFSSQYGENLLEYLQSDDAKRLILRTNYGYMSFVENFNSDVLSLYLLNMADLLIDSGAKPDKEKYMEVLINIIATYDLDNADDISKQKQLDNLKGIEDYAMDCAKIGAKAVSVMAGTSPATTELENAISTAVDGMSVLIDNTENWISALSNLETVVQDYSAHYEFLELIENNSNDNNLKDAAATLRDGMSKAMKIKLDTYSDISNKNFQNYEAFFFSDVFFEVVKQTAEYEADEALSFFVDSGDSIVSSVDVLGDSWELGTMIGTLVGNVVAGGENLINRVLEMMAIYDVSVILQKSLIDTQNNFLSNIGNEEEESYFNKYMSFSQYLIGCRIRGEYCLYSIVANDAGLLNWFNKESAEEAKEWYDNKAEKIINIQNNLLSIEGTSTDETTAVFKSGDSLVYVGDKIIYAKNDGIYYRENPTSTENIIASTQKDHASPQNARNLLSDGETVFFTVNPGASADNSGVYYQHDEVYSVKVNGENLSKLFKTEGDVKLITCYGDYLFYLNNHDSNIGYSSTGSNYKLNMYNLVTGEKVEFSYSNLGISDSDSIGDYASVGTKIYLEAFSSEGYYENCDIIEFDTKLSKANNVLQNAHIVSPSANAQKGIAFFEISGNNDWYIHSVDSSGKMTKSEKIPSRLTLSQGVISSDGSFALMRSDDTIDSDFDLYKVNLKTGKIAVIENGAGCFKNKGAGLTYDTKHKETIYVVGPGGTSHKFNGSGYDEVETEGYIDSSNYWVIDGYFVALTRDHSDFTWNKISEVKQENNEEQISAEEAAKLARQNAGGEGYQAIYVKNVE